MSNFLISIDSSCDYNKKELDSKNVKVIMFNYSCENKIYQDDMNEDNYISFYNNMKKGKGEYREAVAAF